MSMMKIRLFFVMDSDDEDLYIHGDVLVLYTDAYC